MCDQTPKLADTTNIHSYRSFFRKITGCAPFDYQILFADKLMQGGNVLLRAPTGVGKTWAALVPFLFGAWRHRPARLIYTLPLRTLAQGVYSEACTLARRHGLPIVDHEETSGGTVASPFVTLQTAEQPDDPFFDRGRIIVTTYDQLLSGLLDAPYGLSDRLHNVNTAAVAGALVIFDEFHLMEPHRAFLTAAACLHLFRDLCQSVWMTATATGPLEKTLRDALCAEPLPATSADADALLYRLPGVRSVHRRLSVEGCFLSAESVLRRHQRRSIVLLNTVGRAQAMYEELRRLLQSRDTDTSLILLHSRFFKHERRTKEERLRTQFGRDATGSAILVATQVVEAGLDISCEHLHTELCPMNALVQRSGRCARFPDETGTVHVYPLPGEERNWLPYGSLQDEDITLTRTRELLPQINGEVLHPRCTAIWIEQVHGDDDREALREGWQSRLHTCLGRIEQHTVLHNPTQVADLIRGDTDDVRVIISSEATRPDTPGRREGLSVPRWSLARVVYGSSTNAGWLWDWSDGGHWTPVQTAADLVKAYILCLPPSAAAYDSDVGLRLGIAGEQESPSRKEPPRPGYVPLRAETWADHARRVEAEAMGRLEREGGKAGLLCPGLGRRFALSPAAVGEAVRACALLHDLGKLQQGWQTWAEAAQQSKDPNYRHTAPLAHTDFDPESPTDRERERRLSIGRPPHSAVSAYYGRIFLARLLPSVTENDRAYVASACTAAILAHHGGWLSEAAESHPPRLCSGWEAAVRKAIGWAPDPGTLADLAKYRVETLLNATIGPGSLATWWPLVAYLTRTLRLSDQSATAEGALHE